jgi:hypothetical protein
MLCPEPEQVANQVIQCDEELLWRQMLMFLPFSLLTFQTNDMHAFEPMILNH